MAARRSPAANLAGLVFVGALVVAFPLFLVRGNEQWFFLDEWDYLAARSLSLHDILRPHNEHWTTVPIVVYRLLYRVVGLRSYVPYQVLIVSLQLVTAVILRRIMRRADVGPWVATAAASLFLFLGSGRQNIVWAFQIGFVGALVCGLVHLVLADHDGPPDRRDAWGIGLGMLGLLCSGVAVTMVLVVGLAVFVRRGWWPAIVNTLPLGVVYGIWYVAYGADASTLPTASVEGIIEFVVTGTGNAFAQMGQLSGVGAALGVVLVVGLVLAWSRLPFAQVRRRAAVPGAMLVGAAVFLTIAGYGRASFLGPDSARASRYVHIVVALAIPAIAVAADAFARRWRLLTPVVVVLLLVGIPGNVDAIRPTGLERYGLGDRRIVNLPGSPFATRVPRSVRPIPQAHEVTMGWLVDGARSGRIPTPAELTADEVALATLRVVLGQRFGPGLERGCFPLADPVTVTVERGDRFSFTGGALAARLAPAVGPASSPRVFQPAAGTTIRVEGGPLAVIFARAVPTVPVELCRNS